MALVRLHENGKDTSNGRRCPAVGQPSQVESGIYKAEVGQVLLAGNNPAPFLVKPADGLVRCGSEVRTGGRPRIDHFTITCILQNHVSLNHGTITRPPLATIVCPVMNLDSSDNKK